ncbi:hypothetical protein HU200_042100 [Digitaria exilis]|uniref:X8 domain-containing protein n=1 Tax=Digitaria exilis TaxID=1010633 RepID=A0A835B7Z0_9POAL|nr:hypothetical protein HU200_042100 [Digitaria exilis]
MYANVTEAGEVGVCWGTIGDNIPDPGKVVQLLKQNSITMVRIYNTDSRIINALSNTGIKLMVALPNELLADAASSPSYALQWVQDNVAKYYPSTHINGIAVGNEVFDSASNLNQQLVPAMTNVYAALQTLGLDRAIKVSTPVAFSALKVSWRPSQGEFRDDIAQSVMVDLVAFLRETDAPFMINVYPYRAYLDDPNHSISVEWWTFQPNAGHVDDLTGRIYYSLYDAQMDALRYAIGKVSPGSSLRASLAKSTRADDIILTCTECGCSRWNIPPHQCRDFANGLISYTLDASTSAARPNYMASRLLGSAGGGATSAYIFALFDENSKPGDESERKFGLFDPSNMQPFYDVDFVHGSGPVAPTPPAASSWCVANTAIGDERLQEALDWACGHGADCSAIQPGARCFIPDTKEAHATYAFNDYYQRNGRASSACDFNGAGSIVYQQPSELLIHVHRSITSTYASCSKLIINPLSCCDDTDICDPNQPESWCVARADVGDALLQVELDWACGHGADCSAIQPGGPCFDPDTTVSHASYAFNDYYQRNS